MIILEEVILKVLEGSEINEMSRHDTADWIFLEVTRALNENGIEMREDEIGALEYAS